MIHKVINRLVSQLEKGKPSPISPFLFHLYSNNKCLRDEEIDEIEAARKYLGFGISSETVTISDEAESEQSSKTKPQPAGTSSSGRMRSTYRSLEDTTSALEVRNDSGKRPFLDAV